MDMNNPLSSSSTSLSTNSGSWLTREGIEVDSCEDSLPLSISGFTSRHASTSGAKSTRPRPSLKLNDLNILK
ncbi:hypothetical protein AYI69_g3536 [Smittium culicis]|uniref:Uncharacterized protein n=1 Tax=Smittium culicis TaxID=133412 RepID=A0A1R1YJG7_9FUNG|nr:hypothetical protein AYI69_g3536 [Smittium culicis]